MQPRAGRIGAAERAGVGMTTGGWRLDVRGPVESREYILYLRTYGTRAVRMRVGCVRGVLACVWSVFFWYSPDYHPSSAVASQGRGRGREIIRGVPREATRE